MSEQTAPSPKKAQRTPAILAGIVIVLCAAWLVYYFVSDDSAGIIRQEQRAFFTTDDGVTLFTDDAAKLPPFDHNGKPAVRAFAYADRNGQGQWVQYLQSFSDDEKKLIATGGGGAGIILGKIKRPGDKDWIAAGAPGASAIMRPKSPKGNVPFGEIRPVVP